MTALHQDGAGADPQGMFNKLTKRLITALSGVTSEGGLYEVDMALRPSGRSGPLAVSLEAFESYYESKAWTWEYMALSRARGLAASSDDFLFTVNTKIRQALLRKDFGNDLAKDILDMHARLGRDKPAKGDWDIKGVLGGLRDIEFIAQYLMLKHKPYVDGQDPVQSLVDMLTLAQKEAWMAFEDAEILLEIAGHYHTLIQILAISVEAVSGLKELTQSVRSLLAISTEQIDFLTLSNSYANWRLTVQSIFSKTII